METWQIQQIFPSAQLIQDESVPSDFHNDLNFVTDFVKTQLESRDLMVPNTRVKAAFKTVGSMALPVADIYIDILREHIVALQLQSLEAIGPVYFATVEKCRHLSSVSQLGYRQSQLLLRSCSATFQSIVVDLDLMGEAAALFRASLFQDHNDSLLVVSELLASLSLTEELEKIIVGLTTEFVRKRVSEELEGNFGIGIESLRHFSAAELYPRLRRFLPQNELTQDMLFEVVRNEVVKLRTKEIHEMVASFPESTTALNELRFALTTQHQREQLVDSFVDTCNSRLLHAGTDTVRIIQFYMKTVRSFLIVDPRGVLLDKGCRSIRGYLRTRSDTVDRIVNGLLDRSPSSELSELADELFANKANGVDIDDINDLNWTPDPIDALPDFRKRRVGDLIESLFSIFDSRTVFVEAFTKRFAQDLIKVPHFDVREIVTSLNHLKLRFGDEDFNTIDVMIRDIVQSVFIDRHVNLENFRASVISHLFWPVEEYLSDNPIPTFLQPAFDRFSDKYSQLKKGRKLKLIPSLGSVELELHFENGRTASFDVTPQHASVINAFDTNSSELSSEQIAMQTYIDPDTVVEILEYWIKENVLLKKSTDTYVVNENWGL